MSCTELNYQNATKSCPIVNETLKGHMVQMRQGIQYTKPKPKPQSKLTKANSLPSNTTPSHEMHIKVEHIRKLYTDDTVRFPVR